MKMYNIISSSLFIYVIFFTGSINAEILFSYEGDEISYDESSNTYTITYEGENNQINQVNWMPPNDVDLEIKADYEIDKSGNIKYEYELEVSKTSRFPISSFSINTQNLVKPILESPDNWKYFTTKSYNENDSSVVLSWMTSPPVPAGEEVEDFSVLAKALPVYNEAFSRGRSGTLSFFDSGPNRMVSEYWDREVASPSLKGKGVYTAVPMIPISIPFNPVETYSSFHKFLLGYIDKGFIDSSISISLTDASTAVLTALTANDVNTALSKSKEVRNLVEGENDKSQPLILKELGKILSFNLKFIMKKLNS